MTDHYPWQPPQDESHRRVLALEDGLLPGDQYARTDHKGRSAGPRAGIASRAMAWVTRASLVGAGGVGILKAIFWLDSITERS